MIMVIIFTSVRQREPEWVAQLVKCRANSQYWEGKGKGKVHPCTGTEALYRPYGP